jgi:hypothetical protein
MKKILLILFIFSSTLCIGKNWYVSNTGSNSAAGTSTGTAWQSISKVNNSMSSIGVGDSILFKRGDTFTGQLTITKSVKIGAYGNGVKPVFNGFTTLSGWTNLGGGIWAASLTSAKVTLNMVTINDTVKAVGRYPNVNAANGGYLIYESHVGQTSITDNELTSTTNWTGAELALRGWGWKCVQSPITSHVGGTLTSSNPYWEPSDNRGYFIQRDVRTLDKFGEWYFDNSTKKLKMHFGTANPTSYTVKASIRDTIIYAGSVSNFSVENIRFVGANYACIYGNGNAKGNKVKNCDFDQSGGFGVFLHPQTNNTIEGNTFNYMLGVALKTANMGSGGKYCIIRDNIIKNTGGLIGMSPYDGDSGTAISAGNKVLVEYNYIDSVGYNGIRWGIDSSRIQYNYVNYYCHNLDDGGAFYAYSLGVTNTNKSYMYRNITRNAVGAVPGGAIYWLKPGDEWYDELGNTKMYYFDLQCNNVEIRECSGSVSTIGIGLSATRNLSVIDCTFHKSKKGINMYRASVEYALASDVVFTGNIVHNTYPNTVAKALFYHSDKVGNYAGIVTMDYNYWLTPTDHPYRNYDNTGGVTTAYTIPQWQSSFGFDIHGISINTTSLESGIQYVYNNTKSKKTIQLAKPMKTADGVKYSSSITLDPFKSAILLVDNNPAAITVTATAGSISSYGGTTTLTANATGGTTPYTYSLNGGAYQSGNTFNVTAGTYTVTAKDGKGIIATSNTIIVTQPTQNPTTLAVTVTGGTITIYGGTTTLTASATGGSAPYTYSLNGGTYQSGNTFNVTAGTYFVTVKDVNGNIATSNNLSFAQPPKVLEISVTYPKITTSGGTTTLTVWNTGGTGPFSYSLNGGAYQSENKFTVTAGTYTVTIKDSGVQSATTTITITQPGENQTVVAVTATAGTITTYGGSTTLTANATGGTTPYIYSLNGGAYQSGNTFTVTAGTYTVTVMDENDITATSNSITITQPAKTLAVTATAGTIALYGGTTTLTANAIGGATPYTYSLNGSAFQSGNTFTINAGTYIVTVKDGNGITATSNTVAVVQPAKVLSLTLTYARITTYGGTTTLTAWNQGGTGPYTYSLNGGTYKSGNTFTVAAGTHTVTIKDSRGQIATATITITQPAQTTLKSADIMTKVATDESLIDETGLNDDHGCTMVIPNGFSPDGDGINDLFKISCMDVYTDARMSIFKSTGQPVYQKPQYGNVDYWGSEQEAWWDGTNNVSSLGTKLPVGTYIYILELAKDDKSLVKKGTVFIMY